MGRAGRHGGRRGDVVAVEAGEVKGGTMTTNDWRGISKREWMERAQQAERERDELRARLNEIYGLLSADVPATQKERDAWWRDVEAWVKAVSA